MSSSMRTSSTSVVISWLAGTTCPRYFHVSGTPSATGSKRAAAPHCAPVPRRRMAACSACSSASIPSEPGCTGSCIKCALKNQSAARTSFSARSTPSCAAPASGHQPVTRSSISSGSPASAAPAPPSACAALPRSCQLCAAGCAKYCASAAAAGSPAWFANASSGKNPNDVSIVAITLPARRASTLKTVMIIGPSSDQLVSSVRTRSVPVCGSTSSVHVCVPSRLRKKMSPVCALASRIKLESQPHGCSSASMNTHAGSVALALRAKNQSSAAKSNSLSIHAPAAGRPSCAVHSTTRVIKWYGGHGRRGRRSGRSAIASAGPKAALGCPSAHASSER